MKADATEIKYAYLFFIHSNSWYKCFSVNIQSIMQLFSYKGTTNHGGVSVVQWIEFSMKNKSLFNIQQKISCSCSYTISIQMNIYSFWACVQP